MQRALPLQSLVLKITRFIQASLEDFLVVASNFHQIKLVDITSRFQLRGQMEFIIVDYDWKRLIDRVRTLGIKLDSVIVQFRPLGRACGYLLAFVGAHPCARDISTTIPRLFHRYLCESPHLRHLKVLRSILLLETMDYHRRGGYLEPKEENVQLLMSTKQLKEYDVEWSDDFPGI
ncbi:hypothetical protein BG015_007030 [Linnemannia schmuckeri]|uniref:Uncharacterized protein n=1 Tax=Linnemannia schmuckeri TaxID=64567 RepID=A0A9P5S2K3_9FUNG|nr:hypothetical protein BG015_007030 [Linnemannia schmuckeri]